MVDHKREEAVWKRVMELSEQAPPCCRQSREAATAAKVMELLQKEQGTACTYQTLAARVRTDLRQKLLFLARKAGSHCEKLETVCYLMTGNKVCPDAAKRPCITCVGETLRECYMLHTQQAKHCGELSEQTEDFAEVFLELAAEEKWMASEVLCVIRRVLREKVGKI